MVKDLAFVNFLLLVELGVIVSSGGGVATGVARPEDPAARWKGGRRLPLILAVWALVPLQKVPLLLGVVAATLLCIPVLPLVSLKLIRLVVGVVCAVGVRR